MQEVILSRQQCRTTAWKVSILMSQKKKKMLEEVILVSTYSHLKTMGWFGLA